MYKLSLWIELVHKNIESVHKKADTSIGELPRESKK